MTRSVGFYGSNYGSKRQSDALLKKHPPNTPNMLHATDPSLMAPFFRCFIMSPCPAGRVLPNPKTFRIYTI